MDIELTPPRMAVMRRMRQGETRLFSVGEMVTTYMTQRRGSVSAASIASKIGGKFQTREVILIDSRSPDNFAMRALAVTCIDVANSTKPTKPTRSIKCPKKQSPSQSRTENPS